MVYVGRIHGRADDSGLANLVMALRSIEFLLLFKLVATKSTTRQTF
jgi:hypothetical protein